MEIYNVHKWNWEVARGSDNSPSNCQHNILRLGLGSNYDKKSWGTSDIEPLDFYEDGIMYIFIR